MSPPTHRMRRLIITALSLLAVTLPVTASAQAASLSDQQQSALDYAVEAGLLRGDDETGDLRPTDLITRRELILMTIRRIYPNRDYSRCLEWIAPSLPIKYTKLFSDVLITDPSANQFCLAMVTGLVWGQPDGSLRPEGTVTLAEAAKVVSRGFGIYQFGRIDPPDFPWYVQYMDPLIAASALPEGSSMATVRTRLTRVQAAEIFYALREAVADPDADSARASAMIRSANPIAQAAMNVTTPVTTISFEAGTAAPSRRQVVILTLARQLLASVARPVVTLW